MGLVRGGGEVGKGRGGNRYSLLPTTYTTLHIKLTMFHK